MSTPETSKDGVHRLIDIVAEEVSLVDRAANQRRFLVVKRSDPMDDLESEELEPTEDELSEVASSEDEPGGDERAEKASSGDPRLVDAALTTLERLTETVETLSVLADGDARTSIGEIAGELRSLADNLLGTAGATGGAEPVAAAAPTSVGASTPEQVATMIASVRAALAEVGTLLAESKRARPKPPGAAAGAPPTEKRLPESSAGNADGTATPGPSAASAPPAGAEVMHKDLATLTEAMTKLTEATKSHTQRLAHLEKRFGLPNSVPAREQAEPVAENVGWPLDLNRPFDREAVDKSVSFHDL